MFVRSGVDSTRRTDRLGLGLLAMATLLVGCGDEPTPTTPIPEGGRYTILDYEQFEQTISPLLTTNGCDVGGDCHGGGIRGTFELSPVDDKDFAFDFAQVELQVSAYDPAESALLRMPLAEVEGGLPHPTEPFDTESHTDYQTILQWIQDGEVR
jgi:hypothetical protein